MIWFILSIIVILGISGLFRRKPFDGETNEQIRQQQDIKNRSLW